MWTRWVVTAAVAMLAAATPARAFDVYLGASAGEKVDGGTLRGAATDLGQSGADRSYKYFGGLGLGRNLAVEGTYYDFGRRRCCDRVVDAGFSAGLTAWSLAIVGRAPAGPFHVFGKIGAFRWQEDATETTLIGAHPANSHGTELLLGAGAALDLTRHLALRGDLERYEFASGSERALWLGAVVRF